ncbi:hypothetical protein BDP55DRAFT_635885 [Colletotrichum godetiae]|uniref:Uncharacterized protein n=1 Tax=Colletotrichum godetiae TaxID=1209918 RepID=A0AAJ0ETN0_9PEZI|nr:uncharacterized protein BDP55DRAFT_635885 [Colletotrichum godetiae]KAK1671455.1 hypothetical protein BDP55DRAFT_635885 [Colletotrichum godetiae]
MGARRNPSLERARAGQGENVPGENPGFSLDTLMGIAQKGAKDMGGKTLSVGVQSESFAVMTMAHGLEPTLGGSGPLEGWRLRMVLRLLVVSSGRQLYPSFFEPRHKCNLYIVACTLQVVDAGVDGAGPGAVGTWQYKLRSDEGRVTGVCVAAEELGEEEPDRETSLETEVAFGSMMLMLSGGRYIPQLTTMSPPLYPMDTEQPHPSGKIIKTSATFITKLLVISVSLHQVNQRTSL